MKQMTWVQILALSISIPFMPQSSGPQLFTALRLWATRKTKKDSAAVPSCELQTPGHLWSYYKRSEKAYTREKESFRDLRLKTGVKSSRFK